MLATLRNRKFFLVWSAGLISNIGDWMLSIGLPIYVLVLTGSVLLTSLTLMTFFVPNLLFGSLAGVFVDRWNRKRTMVITNILQALGLAPLLFVTSADTIWLVYVSAFVESTLSLFFTPAESALLPQIVDERHLISANSLASVGQSLARLLGPAVGGLVIAVWSLGGVIWLDGASFVIAALLIAPIRASHPSVAPVPGQAAEAVAAKPAHPLRQVLRELGGGLGIVGRDRVVRVLFLMVALAGLGEGLFSVLLVVWVKRVLGGGALELGWTMSAQAVGGLLGGVLMSIIGPRVRPGRLLGVCAVIFGAIDLAIVDAPLVAPPYLPPSPVPQITSSLVLLVLALFVLVGIPGVGMGPSTNTLLQTTVPNTHLGRVMSLYFALLSLTMLGGMAIAGFFGDALGDQLGPIVLLNGQGGMYICQGLLAILFLWGVRVAAKARAEHVPEPATAPSA